MRKLLVALLVGSLVLAGTGIAAGASAANRTVPGLPKDFPIPETATVIPQRGPIPKAGNVTVGINPHKGTIDKAARYFLTGLRRRHYRVATAEGVDDGYGPYGLTIVYGKPGKAMGYVTLVRGSDKHQKPQLLEMLPAVPFKAPGAKPGTVASVHDDQYEPRLESAFAEIGFPNGVAS